MPPHSGDRCMETAAEATEKRARRHRSGDGGGGEDRLSALPDCLLHVIMSSLRARQVVQTCVLSTRWRHLWRSVPCLDLDLDEFTPNAAAPDAGPGHNHAGSGRRRHRGDAISSKIVFINHSSDDDSGGDDAGSGGEDDSYSEFLNDDYSSNFDDDDISSSSSDYSDEYEDFYSVKHEHYVLDKDKNKMWEDFEDFTVNLMRCCNTAELDSFRLHIGDRHRAPQSAGWQASAWIRRAMKQRTPSDPVGPGKRLTSGSWRIKRLHLGNVLLDSRFAEHVRSVCRCLEDLELDDCTCEIQSITSHSLKTLVLRKCTWSNLSKIASPTLKTLVFDGGSNAEDCMLVIMAPAIAYLQLAVKVYEGFEGGITMDEMPSLAKASIYLGEHYYDAGSKLVANHFNLLCSVSHATSLELSCIRKKVLSKEPRFQEFKNLRNLLLRNCNLSNNFRTLTFFLQSSPNLESLTLRRCKFPKYHKKKKGKPKHDKTSSSEFLGWDFLCENLKVEIIYKDGDAHQLVKLLLHATGNLLKNHIKLTRVVN